MEAILEMPETVQSILEAECIKCHEVKDIKHFHRDPTRKSGRKSICRECYNSKRNSKARKDIPVQVCQECGKTKYMKSFSKLFGGSGEFLAYSIKCKSCGDKKRTEGIKHLLEKELVKINLFPDDGKLYENKYPVRSEGVSFTPVPMRMCDVCGHWEYPDRLRGLHDRCTCTACDPSEPVRYKELALDDYLGLKVLLDALVTLPEFNKYPVTSFKLEASMRMSDRRFYSIAVIHFDHEKGINNTLAFHTGFLYLDVVVKLNESLKEIKNYDPMDWVD
jgi:ribosomal protein L32